MDKFLKYVWLLELLYNKKDGMRLEDIKEQWDNNRNLREEGELDTRTFHRYRDRIEELFAVNISCEHYRYFISNRKDMEDDNIRMWLLNTFSINNQVGKNGELRKRILFEEIPSGKYYLTDVIEAMRENRKIKIGYRKYRCDESKEYVLEPYFVKSFKKRWYMIAYDTEAEMVKTFSMDRVTEFFCTSDKFKLPKNFNPQTYFEDCFGIINNDDIPVETLRIKVRNDQEYFLRDLPLHSSQREIENTDDYTIFEFDIKITFDLMQEVLSHGESWEVMAPQHFREEIKKAARQMNENYG
jgi:hypothetical protein